MGLTRDRVVPAGNANVASLLQAAVSEFAEHGFEGVSMRTLAEKCGVTTAVIYHHFGSKEELYNEVCQQKFDDMMREMRQRLAHSRTPEEKLEAFAGTLFDEWYRDNTLLLLTQRDIINAIIRPENCLAQKHYHQLMNLVHRLLSENLARPLDEDFSFSFGAFIYGYCALMHFDRHRTPQSGDEFRRRRRAVLLDYCRKFWDSMPTS